MTGGVGESAVKDGRALALPLKNSGGGPPKKESSAADGRLDAGFEETEPAAEGMEPLASGYMPVPVSLSFPVSVRV